MEEREYPIEGRRKLFLGTSAHFSRFGLPINVRGEGLRDPRILEALRKSARSLGVLPQPSDSVQTHFDNLTE